MEKSLLRIAIVILVLIILISAVALLLRTRKNNEPESASEPAQEAVQPTEPEKGPEPEKEVPQEINETEPEPTPEPEQEPEPEPEPEDLPEEETEPEEQEPEEEPEKEPEDEKKEEIKPVIDRKIDSSSIRSKGSFRSDNGTSLTLTVYWYLVNEGDGKLLLDVDLSAYSLQVGSRYQGITVTVDGKTYQFDSEKVDYEDAGSLTTVDLAFCEIPYDGAAADVSVAWSFLGIYSGVEMESVTAEGHISR